MDRTLPLGEICRRRTTPGLPIDPERRPLPGVAPPPSPLSPPSQPEQSATLTSSLAEGSVTPLLPPTLPPLALSIPLGLTLPPPSQTSSSSSPATATAASVLSASSTAPVHLTQRTPLADEGFSEVTTLPTPMSGPASPSSPTARRRMKGKMKMRTDVDADAEEEVLTAMGSVRDTEELAYKLLLSLPRARLATIQRRIAPLLQFDVVGSLPTEVALQIFASLPAPTLLTCARVSRRWQVLANDPALWKSLCAARGWAWRHPLPSRPVPARGGSNTAYPQWGDSDDEGMGDSDEEGEVAGMVVDGVEAAKAELTLMHAELDSGFASMAMDVDESGVSFSSAARMNVHERHFSAPSVMHSLHDSSAFPFLSPISTSTSTFTSTSASAFAPAAAPTKPDYKLLHQTHTKLQQRVRGGSYRFSTVQTRGCAAPANAHTNTIYCLQLYTYPATGRQVLFTGSRDRSVREWSLGVHGGGSGRAGALPRVERVIEGVHQSSVLSICVRDGYVASAGSDRRVAVWDLARDRLVKVLSDHEDSVLCVRFDGERLVSCSKDRTVRVYSFPALEFQYVLGAHRAAVNAVSISESCIVSASGDRSVRLWDAKTGKLLRTFDNHHTRGIASIDFAAPIVLSGSSDKHVRLFDMTTAQGWSTAPEYDAGMLPPVGVAHHHPHHHHHHHPVPSNNGNGNGNEDATDAVLPFPHSLFGSGVDAAHMSMGMGAGPSTSPTSPLNSTTNINNNNICAGTGGLVCQSCGSNQIATVPCRGLRGPRGRYAHSDLVRTVALGEDFVLSGSYDLSIKVWDRKTGALVADLTGGHTGRIFCIGFDSKKIVSCGEDQRICIWDFSHGIDTSFMA